MAARALAGANTATEAARDVIDLADTLGWQQFAVVGHSMSGMVAQRVSLDARERVRSVVAVTPVPASGVPLDAQSQAMFESTSTSDAAWIAVAKMMTGERLPQRWYERELAHFRASVEPAAYLRFLAMWTATDFSAEMSALTVPALVVLGSHDFTAFAEPAMRQTLGRWYSNSRIETIEGSGHHPMSETPARFVAVVENFLRARGRPDRV